MFAYINSHVKSCQSNLYQCNYQAKSFLIYVLISIILLRKNRALGDELRNI